LAIEVTSAILLSACISAIFTAPALIATILSNPRSTDFVLLAIVNAELLIFVNGNTDIALATAGDSHQLLVGFAFRWWEDYTIEIGTVSAMRSSSWRLQPDATINRAFIFTTEIRAILGGAIHLGTHYNTTLALAVIASISGHPHHTFWIHSSIHNTGLGEERTAHPRAAACLSSIHIRWTFWLSTNAHHAATITTDWNSAICRLQPGTSGWTSHG
jgi:hypothetical protein